MRRGWIGAMVLVSGLSLAGSAKADEWADRLFAEQRHDFGMVPRGVVLRHAFVVKNRLKETVTIADVHASCGCTTGTATTRPIEPGRSAVVEAEMDTRKFVGEKATVLYVTLKAASGRVSEVRLALSAQILSDIVLNPGSLDFGIVRRGESVTRTLAIDRVGMPDWRVERLASTSRFIDGTVVETTRDGKAVGYALRLTLRPDAPLGTLRDEVRLTTNDRETPILAVQVQAQVRGDLTGSPSALSLGMADPANGVKGRYLVRSPRPFTVRAVEGVGDGFVVTADNDSAKPVHVLTVSYRPEPGKARGEVRRAFQVHTDLVGEPPLELTATLRVVGP